MGEGSAQTASKRMWAGTYRQDVEVDINYDQFFFVAFLRDYDPGRRQHCFLPDSAARREGGRGREIQLTAALTTPLNGSVTALRPMYPSSFFPPTLTNTTAHSFSNARATMVLSKKMVSHNGSCWRPIGSPSVAVQNVGQMTISTFWRTSWGERGARQPLETGSRETDVPSGRLRGKQCPSLFEAQRHVS